ncbi:MAG: MFS transporter [Parachlamydiaceae bacterium]|nr:MFS transporter [Parachlamydiaceae bacterium]
MFKFPTVQVEKARVATSFMFLVSGLAYSSWAPMVPYAKARLELNEATLGLILLAFGIGALISMPLTGWAVHRFGSRIISTTVAPLMIALLPLLAIAPTNMMLAALLFVFGATGGAMNISMNSQAAAVEAHLGKPILSGFHCLFSFGGLLGAGLMSLLLEYGLSLLTSSICLFILMITLSLWNCRKLLPSEADIRVAASSQFRLPQGRVLFYGSICFILFLVEGAMLDWGAVSLRTIQGYEASMAGIGYAIFSVAMAIGRFSGNVLITRFGTVLMMRAGALLAATGLFLAVNAHWYYLELLGFLLIGFGAANIVPIMFGAAGKLTDISASFALTIVITMGYTGMLLGPAFIGFVAEATTLSFALGGIAFLLVGVALSATAVAPKQVTLLSD